MIYTYLVIILQVSTCVFGNNSILSPVETIRLTNVHDVHWTGPIRIGETKKKEDIQEFMMIFDTGSSHTWVTSVFCYSQECVGNNKYNREKSNTFEEHGQDFQINYTNAIVEGITSIDTFQIGKLLLKRQIFGEVLMKTTLPREIDGAFGLGYTQTETRPSSLSRMKEQGLIKYKQFCFILYDKNEQLDRHGHEIGGELQIGGCTVQPTMYISLNTIGKWQVTLENIMITYSNGSKIWLCLEFHNALMDSGTAEIFGPESEIQSINNILGAKKDSKGVYRVDCNHIQKLPPLSFIVDGKSLELTSSDYILRSNGFCVTIFKTFPKKIERSYHWIIGSSFMRTRTVLFDMDNHRIGIGPKAIASQLLSY